MMYTARIILAVTTLVFAQTTHALTITRVILATNDNPNYIEFWPVAAKAWQKVVGIRPTLALVADESVVVDETVGDVIRYKPIDGVPTSLHAQLIRLLLPIHFKDEGCIISDIDMLPLSKDYFIKSVARLPDHCFVVYRDRAYKNLKQYPMCYNAAQGKTFADVFGISDPAQIPALIKQWGSLKIGWFTDETLLYRYLNSWQEFGRRCIRLGHDVDRRIDRSNWRYDATLVGKHHYIDAHCPRPYSTYKKEIDLLLHDMGINA